MADEITKSTYDLLLADEELSRLYNENAGLGAEELSGALPTLKIYTEGRTKETELPDGSKPQDGNFFYDPTKEQFSEIVCHILAISRGYYAPSYEKENEKTFNQLMAGVIVNDNQYKPFIFYLTGTKLQPMWDFGKEISAFTKRKPVSIPMFALTVKIKTEKITHKFGESWIPKFEFIRNASGDPEIVADKELFLQLKEQTEKIKEVFENIINREGNEQANDVSDDLPFGN